MHTAIQKILPTFQISQKTARTTPLASESQWKQIVGKTIDQESYVSTQMLKGIYERAMKDIVCITQTNNTNAFKEVIKDLEKQLAQKTLEIQLLREQLLSYGTRLNNLEQKAGYAIDVILSSKKDKQK